MTWSVCKQLCLIGEILSGSFGNGGQSSRNHVKPSIRGFQNTGVEKLWVAWAYYRLVGQWYVGRCLRGHAAQVSGSSESSLKKRTHNAIHRCCITERYTWNLHDSTNQCHSNKLKKKMLRLSASAFPGGMRQGGETYSLAAQNLIQGVLFP